jgi:oligoribonuclease (3'-5' exoribonuclease)
LTLHRHVLWLDLETTGHDQFQDLILEVAGILTPRDCGRELMSFVAVAEPERVDWKDLMAPEVRAMHEKSGLVEAIESGVGEALDDIESRLIERITGTTLSTDHVILAGAGVSHFDRRFLIQQMPRLARCFTYWAWDVSTVGRFFREALPDNAISRIRDLSGKKHRALPDARQALNEWRRFIMAARFVTSNAAQERREP